EKRYSTKELLSIEGKMMKRVSQMASDTRHEISSKVLSQVIGKRPTLSDEQLAALRHAAGGSAISLIEGDAGTGKTYLLNALTEAYKKKGYTVYGAALAGVAADGLREGAGIEDSKTVARLLLDLKGATGAPSTFHGREKVEKPAVSFTEKTLLILD